MAQLPGVTLRPAQEDDLSQIVNLDRLAFSPLSSNEEIERDWFHGAITLPDRQLFLAIEDATGQGVGSYAQIDFEIWFEGGSFPAMGLAAVAVAPHRRGQRVARLMLEHALEMAKAQHLPLMTLYPFQHGFYRKLGWAWVERTHQYRVSTRHIPAFQERANILPFNPSQQQVLQSVYEKAATRHNGWFQRRPWQWEDKLKTGNGREIYSYSEAGEVQGYLILQFAYLEPPYKLLVVVVQEWVALTASAYRGILGFLGSLRDQVSTVVWNTFPSDIFPHLLKEQRRDPALPSTSFEFGITHRFGEIGGGFMWRLVDLERAFELRPIRSGEPFALAFQVTDPVFGERAIAAEFSNNHMTSLEQAPASTLKTSIEHLTELFFGVRRATDLFWMGEIEYEGDPTLLQKLDTAWQATPPFCWDFF